MGNVFDSIEQIIDTSCTVGLCISQGKELSPNFFWAVIQLSTWKVCTDTHAYVTASPRPHLADMSSNDTEKHVYGNTPLLYAYRFHVTN